MILNYIHTANWTFGRDTHENDLMQIQTQIDKYKTLFPEHKDFKVYGGIAGLAVPQNVQKKARELGFFVLEHQVQREIAPSMRPHTLGR